MWPLLPWINQLKQTFFIISTILLGALIVLSACFLLAKYVFENKWQDHRIVIKRQIKLSASGIFCVPRYPHKLRISKFRRQKIFFAILNCLHFLYSTPFYRWTVSPEVEADYIAAKRARKILAAVPDPPDRRTRRMIDSLVSEQRRLIAELENPAIFLQGANSERDELQEELRVVRRDLRRIDPSKIDHSYFLDREGEASE